MPVSSLLKPLRNDSPVGKRFDDFPWGTIQNWAAAVWQLSQLSQGIRQVQCLGLGDILGERQLVWAWPDGNGGICYRT